MKIKEKRFLLQILILLVIAGVGISSILTSMIEFRENGGKIYVTSETADLFGKALEAKGIPYGRVYENGYECFESRPELMPILSNLCHEIGAEAEQVYMQSQNHLFYSIILSAAALCIYLLVSAAVSEKCFVRYLLLTAAFLTAAGCLLLLADLPLAVM